MSDAGVPCVRVAREDGERTRERLAEAGALDDDHEIVVEDDWLYLPVSDRAAVPSDLTVVERAAPERTIQQTPADLLGWEPSYERLGDVVVLDEDDPERAREIADAVVASDLPVETVLNRASKVKGELRVRDWEVLAGGGTETSNESRGSGDSSPGTETVHREYGHEFALDLAEVYFSPRLATERHRVVEQVGEGERALDMFAGVGPFAVPMASRGAEVVAVDLNPVAVEYLRENARRNGVADRVTAIEGDVCEVADEYADWADRLVMNLPHSADDFLDAAVALAGDDAVLHYYDIQHEDDPYGPGEAAIRAAAEPEYEVGVETRHTVRSYAPHEYNVCLDVRLRR
jgi:tRNA (guanine37-N1)-methyltransferase